MSMSYAAIVSLLVQRGLSRPEAEELADALQWHDWKGDAHSQVASLYKIAELFLFVGMQAVEDFLKA